MDALQTLFPERVDFDHHVSSRARMGTDEICDALESGTGLFALSKSWREGAEAFKCARAPYLLY